MLRRRPTPRRHPKKASSSNRTPYQQAFPVAGSTMKTRSFLQFVGPSVVMMLLLLAVPMATTFFLSVRNCTLDMEMVKVEESSPFGKKEVLTQRARLDASGRAIETCRFVGLDYYRKVLGLESQAERAAAPPADVAGGAVSAPSAKAESRGCCWLQAVATLSLRWQSPQRFVKGVLMWRSLETVSRLVPTTSFRPAQPRPYPAWALLHGTET